jgi:hypothetical protein
VLAAHILPPASSASVRVPGERFSCLLCPNIWLGLQTELEKLQKESLFGQAASKIRFFFALRSLQIDIRKPPCLYV